MKKPTLYIIVLIILLFTFSCKEKKNNILEHRIKFMKLQNRFYKISILKVDNKISFEEYKRISDSIDLELSVLKKELNNNY